MSNLVFVAMGSNIDPLGNMPAAAEMLADALEVSSVSSVYETDPVGRIDQPRFLNAALLARTTLTPEELKLGLLRPIEARLGRVRTSDRNAPRTIDLDIALFGDLVVDDPASGIQIPDPDIERRAHLALPLADLAPGFVHPANGCTLASLARPFADSPGVRLLTMPLLPMAA